MAAALKQVSAARAHVDEPRTAPRRPDVRSEQEPDLLARQEPGQVLEQVECVPLVADRADGAGPGGYRHDLRGVLGRAGDGLLQVDGHPVAQGGDGRFPVGTGRGADDQRPDVLAVEQVAPVQVDSRAGARGQGLGSLAVDVAHRHELGVHRGIQDTPVLPRDPPGTDHTHPDDGHAASTHVRQDTVPLAVIP